MQAICFRQWNFNIFNSFYDTESKYKSVLHFQQIHIVRLGSQLKASTCVCAEEKCVSYLLLYEYTNIFVYIYIHIHIYTTTFKVIIKYYYYYLKNLYNNQRSLWTDQQVLKKKILLFNAIFLIKTSDGSTVLKDMFPLSLSHRRANASCKIILVQYMMHNLKSREVYFLIQKLELLC